MQKFSHQQFLGKLVKKTSKKRRKPFLTHQVDGHTVIAKPDQCYYPLSIAALLSLFSFSHRESRKAILSPPSLPPLVAHAVNSVHTLLPLPLSPSPPDLVIRKCMIRHVQPDLALSLSTCKRMSQLKMRAHFAFALYIIQYVRSVLSWQGLNVCQLFFSWHILYYEAIFQSAYGIVLLTI